jgi:SP family sugar:H+ symporter-like MFS transporter
MAVSIASNWLWNFLIAFFTPVHHVDHRLSVWLCFAGCCLAAAVTVYFFLMESQGRTLEEVDTMYIMGIPPRSSKYIASGSESPVGSTM